MNLASEVIIIREGVNGEPMEPVMMALMNLCDFGELTQLLCSSLGRPPDNLTIDGHGIGIARYYSPGAAP